MSDIAILLESLGPTALAAVVADLDDDAENHDDPKMYALLKRLAIQSRRELVNSVGESEAAELIGDAT